MPFAPLTDPPNLYIMSLYIGQCPIPLKFPGPSFTKIVSKNNLHKKQFWKFAGIFHQNTNSLLVTLPLTTSSFSKQFLAISFLISSTSNLFKREKHNFRCIQLSSYAFTSPVWNWSSMSPGGGVGLRILYTYPNPSSHKQKLNKTQSDEF